MGIIKKNKNIDRWADGAIVYQIYPRSFQDSDGDGIGDLPGVVQRLDYLKELGVNAIWLSPFYPSPMADFGYDVKDYCDVDPMFGTLADFRWMLHEAHKRDIHILIDIVFNHTSDEHPWFLASKADKKNRYADWYLWKDPKGYDAETGKPIPPNNWLDIFAGNSSWEWNPTRKQFYLHSFHTKQPDLNLENPKVREALKKVLRFWLDMGVDGFRVDTVEFMGKDLDFVDEPVNPNYDPKYNGPYEALIHNHSHLWPTMYKYINEIALVLNEKAYRQRPRFMVTEAYVGRDDTIKEYLQFYRAMNPRVAAPFIFEGVNRPWDARDWHAFLRDFHQALNEFNPLAVSSYAFGNHDQSRIASRYGAERARTIAVMELTLPGMVYIYNGEEIGMHDVEIPANRIQDPGAVGGGGRDPERTPMQWSPEPGAGFTTAPEPWLPLAHDYKQHNAEVQIKDDKSSLNLYRALGRLRNANKALTHGKLTVLGDNIENILAFQRSYENDRFTTVVNYSDVPRDYHLETPGYIVISSVSGESTHTVERQDIKLKPHEAVVIKH